MINAATKKFDAKVREGLAEINIQTSEHKPYELLLRVFNILYNNHISIQNAFFYSDTEIIVILSDKDAATAYELLRTRIAK